MKIVDNLIPIGKYNRPGTKSVPKRICVHYTGDIGASADRLALFFTTNPAAETSSQYIVGMNGEVIRCVPDDEIAYAAAGKNSGTIHIEVCYKQTSGEFDQASKDALRELVQELMQKYKLTSDKVVRHYDLTGKLCPYYYVDETRWAALHEYITAPEVKPSKLYRVQVGAFANKTNAEAYMAKVKAAGFSAFIVNVDNKGALYRAQVGAFSNRNNADNYAETIRKEGVSAVVFGYNNLFVSAGVFPPVPF